MGESRGRFVAMVGTIALHVGVVWFLAASPEATARVLNALPMDVVDLTPAAPEPEPEPEPEPPEVEEPPPEKRVPQKRPRRRERPQRRVEPEEATPEDAPEPQEDPAPAGPPPVIDFGEANMAAPGSGTGWGMKASHGGSSIGVYRPGSRGGSGGGGSGSGPGVVEKATGFRPVPRGQVSRQPSPIGGRPTPTYTAEARRQSIEGVARVVVEIRSNGSVRNVRVVADPGAGLGAACADAVRRSRWRPARDREGQNVDYRLIYTCRFILDDF